MDLNNILFGEKKRPGKPLIHGKDFKCKRCERQLKHHAKGFCRSCYTNNYLFVENPEKGKAQREKSIKRYMEKYNSDPEFKKKEQERHRKYTQERNDRKRKELGIEGYNKWNAAQQRKHRKNNPASFNFTMGRYYYRKLTDEQRKRLKKECD